MADSSILVWLVALELVGLCALPLAVRVFRRLDDRGYGLAKPLGLALIGYLAWALGSLGMLNTTQPAVVLIALLVAGGLWLWNGREALAFLRAQRRLILVSEAVFLVGFFLAVVVRAFTPAINGQEKFMDMAIYHAFLRSDQLPAEDPWLSDYGMAYYYLGYFLWAMVARVTDVLPAVGYNLALAGTLGLLCAGVFSVAYTLVLAQLRPSGDAGQPAGAWPLSRSPHLLAAALAALGALMVAVMGNLQAAVEAAIRHGIGDIAFWRFFGVKNISSTGPAPGLFPDDGAWWFHAARVIPNVQPDGITEFPWFSLLLGDLHPHFVALPFDLLVIGLAVVAFRNLLVAAPRPAGAVQRVGDDHRKLDIAVAALALGLLIPLNTWDVGAFWVIYALAVIGALVLAERARRATIPTDAAAPPEAATAPRVLLGPFPVPPLLLRAATLLGATFGLAIALYLPYFLGYQSQPLAIDVVHERTLLGSLLILFGPLLVLAIAAVARGWLDGMADPGVGRLLDRYWLAIGVVGVLLLVVAYRDRTLGLILVLLLGTTPLVLTAWRRPGGGILAPTGLLLLMCTIGLLLGTELLFIKDSFGSRMNTVFKFYYHIWLLLGLLSPLLIAYLLRGPVPLPTSDAAASPVAGDAPTPTAARSRAARSGGLLAFALGATAVVFAGALTLAGLLYPLGATATKTGSFRGPATLDGAAWMETSRPGDAQAVRWLRERVPGRPVIAEAFGDDYTEAARVSTFAGLPTLLGWIGHELQWRGPQNEFDRRKQTVEAIYRTADPATLLVVLQGLKLEYVYVGRMEVEKYGPAVRDRFEGRMDVVYRGGDVTIYRLPQTTGIGVGLAEVRP